MKTALGYKLLTEGAQVPSYSSAHAAGADLFADEELLIGPGKWALIKTGIALEIPVGYEVQIRSRSGLALKSGISVLNAPGTIDSDYRGEIGVILMNHNDYVYHVHKGDKIAQMVIAQHETAYFFSQDELSTTERGQGGFGSTGK